VFHINIATTNSGKIFEFNRIYSNFVDIGIIPQNCIALNKFDTSSIQEPIEDGLTFSQNSEIKFLYYEKFGNFDSKKQLLITEDSGFEIPAIDNFPSIHSARFLKEYNSKEEAFFELKSRILKKNLDPNQQKAHFVCDICTRIDGKIMHFNGTSSGNLSFDLLKSAIPTESFGYDPLFIPENFTQTFSQMQESIKDGVSHRKKAFLQFLKYLLNL
jgi:XTP/dITP diphosphohydrolase